MESLKGKLTEEEARELINNYVFFTHENHEEAMLKLWKQKGYIKPGPVETAQSVLNTIRMSSNKYSYYELDQQELDFIIKGFNYLKKQLEEK